VRLLVFDLDGTLLEKDGTLDPRTVDLLKQLDSSGVKSTIATGRSLKSARHFIETLPLKIPVVLFNGARVYDPASGSYIYSKSLPWSVVERFVSRCREVSVSSFFFVDEDVYAMNPGLHASDYIFRDGLSYFSLTNLSQLSGRTVTKIVIAGLVNELTKLKFSTEFNDPRINVTRSEENLLEVLPAGVSKAEALKWLCGFLRLDLKDVVAFGNGENDLEMIKTAGTGITFADAPPSLRYHARMVLSTCGYVGLREFVEKHIERAVLR